MEPGETWFGPDRAGKDRGDVPGGAVVQHLGLRPERERVLGVEAERDRHAAASNGRVDGDEVGECHADSAEADGKAGRRNVGECRLRSRAAHASDEPRRPDAFEQFDGRYVQRQLQRPPEADRAVELAIEILRRVAGEIDRPILDQRFGVRDAELEGETVDERLQRRAWRAQGAGHVDEAVAPRVEEVRGADRCQDLSGPVVGDQDGDGNGIGEGRRRARRQALAAAPGRGASMVSRWTGFAGASTASRAATCGASIGKGRRASGTGSEQRRRCPRR